MWFKSNARSLRELVNAGCKYIQIDAPGYTRVCRSRFRLDRMRSRGEDPEAKLSTFHRRRQCAHRRLRRRHVRHPHLPRQRPHHRSRKPASSCHSGTAKAPTTPSPKNFSILSSTSASCSNTTATAPAASSRCVSCRKTKLLCLGLVSTKNSDMETVDDLKRRIDQASKFLPVDQLALSPQCGFGGLDSKVLSEDEMWKKLDTIVETARKIWG